jgi:hypothetical protein
MRLLCITLLNFFGRSYSGLVARVSECFPRHRPCTALWCIGYCAYWRTPLTVGVQMRVGEVSIRSTPQRIIDAEADGVRARGRHAGVTLALHGHQLYLKPCFHKAMNRLSRGCVWQPLAQ